VPEESKPLTRDDVIRLIEENGGTADGLDLSGADMRGIDLHGDDDLPFLWGIIAKGANLSPLPLPDGSSRVSNLRDASFLDADLRGAHLLRANLQGAHLVGTDLRGADLMDADLRGAHLGFVDIQGTQFVGFLRPSRETELEGIDWGPGYILGDEQAGEFEQTMSTYRTLKSWHQEHGTYDVAGEFHYREWVCRRKTLWQLFTRSWNWRNPSIWLKASFLSLLKGLAQYVFYEELFGYGERPWRVVRAALVVVPGLALAYFFLGSFPEGMPSFIDVLYYSAASFTALGYGGWVPQPDGWARYMGVAESFLGVFLIALFLVTFTRRWTR